MNIYTLYILNIHHHNHKCSTCEGLSLFSGCQARHCLMKSMASLVNMTIVVMIMMTMIGRRMMTMMTDENLEACWRSTDSRLLDPGGPRNFPRLFTPPSIWKRGSWCWRNSLDLFCQWLKKSSCWRRQGVYSSSENYSDDDLPSLHQHMAMMTMTMTMTIMTMVKIMIMTWILTISSPSPVSVTVQ